jgi:eukaryotic-like serine/threonine-protein kinase
MPDHTYRVQPGEVLLNKFEVIRPLGHGHFGEVHHVINLPVGHPAALKIIEVTDPTMHRAVVEAQAQNLCSHDHVVKIHGADVIDGFVLIEMEFIEGGSLGDRLMQGFVPLSDGVQAVKEVLFALEHAHSRGIVHRDVKPANIMLAQNKAKLSDFGTIIQPQTGVRVTDLFYQFHAAPEAVNSGEFSPQGDVFAAGLTLLRVANNMPGWGTVIDDAGTWETDLRNGTMARRIGFKPYLPKALKTILRKACDPDPTRRYASAALFREALERLGMARRWVRVSDNEWTCESTGRIESVRYVNGRHPAVEFFSGSRRQLDLCGTFGTEREAREHMDRVIAETTMGRPAPSRRPRSNRNGTREAGVSVATADDLP